jgi:hypothetical protein
MRTRRWPAPRAKLVPRRYPRPFLGRGPCNKCLIYLAPLPGYVSNYVLRPRTRFPADSGKRPGPGLRPLGQDRPGWLCSSTDRPRTLCSSYGVTDRLAIALNRDRLPNCRAQPRIAVSRKPGSHPHLASVLLQGRKSANIRVSFGVIGGSRLKWRRSCQSKAGCIST